jgi:hypothetical protein
VAAVAVAVAAFRVVEVAVEAAAAVEKIAAIN